MEHKPLMSMSDGLEVTYSDLKDDGEKKFITLYFEKPNNNRSGFDSAEVRYPGTMSFDNVKGFDKNTLNDLRTHAKKLAPLAYEFSLEDAKYA